MDKQLRDKIIEGLREKKLDRIERGFIEDLYGEEHDPSLRDQLVLAQLARRHGVERPKETTYAQRP